MHCNCNPHNALIVVVARFNMPDEWLVLHESQKSQVRRVTRDQNEHTCSTTKRETPGEEMTGRWRTWCCKGCVLKCTMVDDDDALAIARAHFPTFDLLMDGRGAAN